VIGGQAIGELGIGEGYIVEEEEAEEEEIIVLIEEGNYKETKTGFGEYQLIKEGNYSESIISLITKALTETSNELIYHEGIVDGVLVEEGNYWEEEISIEALYLIKEGNKYTTEEGISDRYVEGLVEQTTEYELDIFAIGQKVSNLIESGHFMHHDFYVDEVIEVEMVDVQNDIQVIEHIGDIEEISYIYVQAEVYGEEKGILINAKPNDERYGEVKGYGIYAKGDEAVLEAIPNTDMIGGQDKEEIVMESDDGENHLEVGDEIKRENGEIYVEGKEDLKLKEVRVEV